MLSYLKNSEPKPSGRPPRYEEQNVKSDERNCRAVGRVTLHGIMKQKLSADTKRIKEVRQRALEANLEVRRAVGREFARVHNVGVCDVAGIGGQMKEVRLICPTTPKLSHETER